MYIFLPLCEREIGLRGQCLPIGEGLMDEGMAEGSSRNK